MARLKLLINLNESEYNFCNKINLKKMADISKCEGTNCPLKEKCYRYTVKDDEYWQSYFTKIPYDIESGECDYLWERKE